MKIALIQCPVWGTYDPPMALAQLSGCLRKERHEVSVLDLNIELYLKRKANYEYMWAWEQCSFWYDPAKVSKFFADNQALINQYLSQILASNPRVVCFSVASSSRLASLEFARLIKRENKDIVIVFGGTLFFEERWVGLVLNEEVVDIIAYGEGEITLCELARLIEQGKPLGLCLGIVFKDSKEIFNNPPRPFIENLDELPFMDFSGLPLTNYDDRRHIPFLSSRGCVQKCVFCSSRTFWPGYRRMSGERIFEEILLHRLMNKEIGSIDFLDLAFNGDVDALRSFSTLMANSYLNCNFTWTANAIIRPDMTPELLKKMKDAGCKHLIYGIESGSQKILNLMKKRYKIEDADAVIKATHDAGIVVTANFMFGFPGEEENDFKETLDFIRRNSKYLDRVYPSRTFCAVEEFSYFHAHLNEFGVKPNPPNHLYWESIDGRNTYPERLRRCEEFCELAASLGIEVGCGVQTSVELDRWFNLADYYEQKEDIKNALDCYLKYYDLDSRNEIVTRKICGYFDRAKDNEPRLIIEPDLLSKLEKTANSIRSLDAVGAEPKGSRARLGREKSIAMAKIEQSKNSQLIDAEYNKKQIALRSSPRAFFLQASGPCNANCVFCSRGSGYEMFNLETYRRRFEENISLMFDRAEQIIFTGSGEFLLLPEGEEILDYFDTNFPHVNKVFSTNGLALNPKICEKIAYSKSKYTIHASIHSSNNDLHKLMTRDDNFYKIIGQLNYLLKLSRITGNPTLNLIFVATTLNIEDLPNFVMLAANMGVEKIICYYNYVYIPTQKYLSCFFKQGLTNQMLDEAEALAKRLSIKIDLPPRFSQKEYPVLGICREPWNQVMFDLEGHILPCDASEDCSETLREARQFYDIWNSGYYRNLRQSLIDGTSSCFKYCLRANPASVNDFRSHVIRRGRKESEVDILWGNNFNNE